MSKRAWPRGRIVAVTAMGLILLVLIGIQVWLSLATYPAFSDALAMSKAPGVRLDGETWIVEPAHPRANLVFYQGGLVATEAYIPLAKTLAEHGFRVYLPRMPLNLAILKTGAFEAIRREHPDTLPWLIGGHSLGGTSAILQLNSLNTDQVAGLFLLAAYGTDDTNLVDVSWPVVSITASSDGVLQRDRFEAYRSRLPAHTVYREIAGGNHAGFGNYGAQAGDGKATISPTEQQALVAELLAASFLETAGSQP